MTKLYDRLHATLIEEGFVGFILDEQQTGNYKKQLASRKQIVVQVINDSVEIFTESLLLVAAGEEDYDIDSDTHTIAELHLSTHSNFWLRLNKAIQ